MNTIRLRRYTNAGQTRGAVLPHLQLTLTATAPASLTFTLDNAIAKDLTSPFGVGVEVWNGQSWIEPDNCRMVAKEDSGDSGPDSTTTSFTAVTQLWWQFGQGLVSPWWGMTVDDALSFENKHAGEIMTQVFDVMKTPGAYWGYGLTRGFDATNDANGVPWAAEDRVGDLSFRMWDPLSKILNAITSQGLAEWAARGTQFALLRPGTGTDRSDAVKLGPGAKAAPYKASTDDMRNWLTLVGDGTIFGVDITENIGEWGRLYGVVSMQGVSDAASMRKLAQPTIDTASGRARQLSFDYDETSDVLPWKHYLIGDTVSAVVRGAVEKLRVVSIVVDDKPGEPTKYRVTVGQRIRSQDARTAGVVASSHVGQVIAGNGSPLPTGSTVGASPKAPTGLHIEANEGAFREDGSRYAAITAGWAPVSQAVDDSQITIARYELWMRSESTVSRLLTAVTGTSAGLELPSGESRMLKVRAQSRAGLWSDFSPEVSVEAATPLSIVPRIPENFDVAGNAGFFAPDGSALARVSFDWTPVTWSTDDAPVSIVSYELWDGTDEDPGVAVLSTTAAEAAATWPAGITRTVRLRALSDMGVWSDFTEPLTVDPATPTGLAAVPTAPVLTTGVGFVSGRWDGEFTAPVVAAGVQQVLVEVNLGDGWQRLAMPIPKGGGGFNVRAGNGTDVSVRLRAVDTLGRESADTSAVESIVSVGTGPDDIIAGAIQVNHLSPAVGETLDISANGSVNIIVSQQQQTAGQLASAMGNIDAAAAAAQAAANAASAAQAGVDSVQGQVDEVAEAQAATAEQVSTLQTWFRVDGEGAHVGATGSAFQTHVKPDRFEITENGVVATYWSAGRMVVPALDADELSLPGFKFEQYGSGMVVRFLGV